MSLRYLASLWNRFWFKEQSALSIALFRIFYGLILFEYIILLAPDLHNWLGDHAWTSIGIVQLWEASPRFSFFANQSDPSTVNIVFALLVLFSITLTLGLFSRLSAFMVFICLTSIHHRNPLILHSGDTMIRLCSYFLMWSQCGKRLSLDCLFPKLDNEEDKYNPWAQRLLQLQVCAVYWTSFWGKAAGQTWLNGTAVYYALHLAEFQRFPMPFGIDQLWFCQALTYFTLFVEFSLCTLIWIKEFRYPVIIAGILLHLGLDYSLNIPLFQHMMIVSYLLFVDPQDLKKLFARINRSKTVLQKT